ncbi:YaiO family outer membrane beta-barrel protein [Daejeonella lutea]|uniref:Outer membrane protein, YaiO family n=1 Tax=Daejeonella lutea TaxID=572036 RepID=A0A1T5CVE3_9SPHI|nr:YaiO family outer membrane beta-barrel protein [Daejeonella lutea]SKB63465.1 outer membrane protein, YaiO family [Daejeonella lutea]
MRQRLLYILTIGFCLIINFSSFAQAISSDELFKQALDETNINKNYPRAIALAQSALAISPDYTDIRLLLGRIYVLSGRDEEGIAEYSKVLAKHAGNMEALNALFNLSVRLGRNDDALKYADAIERAGSSGEIRVKKADLLKTMGRYDEAVWIAGSLLTNNPVDTNFIYLYKDIRFSEGKYLMSKGDTAKALLSYEDILRVDPADTVARNLAININLERKDYHSAGKLIDSGLNFYTNNASIFTKKLSLLQLEGDMREAYLLADSLVKANTSTSQIVAIRDETFLLSRQNRIGLSTSVTMFDQPERNPWALYSLFYMRQEKGISMLGRINYADRVNRKGYQFELEAYPKHGKTYSFVNLAFSDSFVFPKIKFSYSYFFPLSKSWESEIGIRYLNADSDFKGFTGAVGKYFNKYWANIKTFQTASNGKLVGSYIFTNRYYFNDNSDDYLTAIAGYGFSPEDVARNFDFLDRVTLESLRFTLGYQKTVLRRGILGLFGTWNKQEYTPGKTRNEFDVSVSFQHKF